MGAMIIEVENKEHAKELLDTGHIVCMGYDDLGVSIEKADEGYKITIYGSAHDSIVTVDGPFEAVNSLYDKSKECGQPIYARILPKDFTED